MANELSGILAKYDFIVAFDVETTGIDPYKDQIIELAAQRLFKKDGKLYTNQFHCYISLYDGHKISAEAQAVNHISEDILAEKGINIESAIAKFKDFIGESSIIIAHNANFDMLFVSVAALKVGCLPFFQSKDIIDTLTVFKDRAPYPHKLSDAIHYYGLEGTVKNSHSADDDSYALLSVFSRMANERNDLLQYVNLFGYNPKYPPQYRLKNIQYLPQPYGNFSPLYNRSGTCNKSSLQGVAAQFAPLTDKKIANEVSAQQTFLRGVEYVRLQRIRNIRFDKSRGLFTANVLGSQIYNSGVQLTETGDILGYFCDCEAYRTYPQACKHIVALSKYIQQNWSKFFSESYSNPHTNIKPVYEESPTEEVANPDYWEIFEDNSRLGAPYKYNAAAPYYNNYEEDEDETYGVDPDDAHGWDEYLNGNSYGYPDYDEEIDERMDDNFYTGDGDDW